MNLLALRTPFEPLTPKQTNFLLEDDLNFVFLTSVKDHLESTVKKICM